jgi:hypothetical protein
MYVHVYTLVVVTKGAGSKVIVVWQCSCTCSGCCVGVVVAVFQIVTEKPLFQILTERMSLEKPKGLEPESSHRIENSGQSCNSAQFNSIQMLWAST